MILDRITLKTSLSGLVGFYSPDTPEYPTLLPSLLVSRSGRRVNEAHSLLTIENIDQSVKNFSNFIYPAYSGTTDTNGGYTSGSRIAFSGTNYEFIDSTPSAGTPPPNTTLWRVIDELSDYLIKAYDTGLDRMMDAWIDIKTHSFNSLHPSIMQRPPNACRME